jgi:lysyl-tRNA synthetase class 2
MAQLTAIEIERENRIQKAQILREKGQNPYTEEVSPEVKLNRLKTIKDRFDSLKGESVTVAGYIKSLRLSGKIGFTTVEDDSLPEGFQFIFKSDLLESSPLTFEDFKELVDRGDYIQVTGKLDLSQRGEPSVFVSEYRVLTKSLRSLPEQLDDIEIKYRKRYIDMKLHPEVREMFRKKSKFWQSTRDFMLKYDFLELQAPTLEHTTGGAEATPFSTHHNALDEDFYLRISSELFLKRYIAGGFERVFDIDKNYRNEGIDDEHLQEYTQFEFYWAYSDFEEMLQFSEKLIKYVIQHTFDTLELTYQDKIIDWSQNWPRMSYYGFIEKFAGISLQEYDTVEKLKSLADSLNLKYNESDGYGRMLDLIYKKTARPKCIEPVWLVDHPVAISPLAKRNPKNIDLTLRSQLIAYGSELTNGFAELNDPVDQLSRFEEQQALREQGDDEAMMIDTDFVEALEYGIPPTCGFAYSERLFSVLMQKPIRETTAFPLMKREK